VSYQQPPDDPYQQQSRPPSFTPHRQDQPPYGPPPGQQMRYRQPQEPHYGRADGQPVQQHQPGYPLDQRANPPQAAHPGHRAHRRAAGKQYALRGAEGFWYVLGCIAMGAAYFSKLPGKKAACEVFSELQLDGRGPSRSYSLHGMESFWYVLMCLGFGAGYFAKVSAKKALWELVGIVQAAPGEYAGAIGRALSGSADPYRPGY
jgi:hypothetical protein